MPDRQRTLRELELGRTLVKDGDKCGRQSAMCFLAGTALAGLQTHSEVLIISMQTKLIEVASDMPCRWVIRHRAGDYKTGAVSYRSFYDLIAYEVRPPPRYVESTAGTC